MEPTGPTQDKLLESSHSPDKPTQVTPFDFLFPETEIYIFNAYIQFSLYYIRLKLKENLSIKKGKKYKIKQKNYYPLILYLRSNMISQQVLLGCLKPESPLRIHYLILCLEL